MARREIMIKIFAIDKIRERALNASMDIYTKRLHNKIKLEIVELQPAKYISFDNIQKAKDFEADKILDMLKKEKNAFVISLHENGKQYTSIEFSKLIFDIMIHKNIIFIIGGAYGLSEKILKKSDCLLSLSNMTFTHEMVRLFLLEQAYRAFTINNNINYHKT